jgi:hypothetical protein
LAVLALQGQYSGAPALRGDSRALGSDNLFGRTSQIAQCLPADGGVGVE